MFRGLILAALAAAGTAAAQGEPGLRDLMYSRNFAMGGAYRSLGLGPEAVNGNPAALGLFKRYQVELSGAWDIPAGYAFGSVGVVDSATSELAAGLSYHLVTLGRDETRRTAHINTLALDLPLSENLHIGVSGRHLLETGAVEANGITMDAGILVRFTEALVVGFSGHNLIDISNPDLTRYYALSVGWLGGLFSAGIDVRADFGIAETVALAYSAGLEYIIAGQVPVRGGYSLDTISHTQHVSLGVGWMNEQGGIDVAYRHEIGGLDGRLISVTFKVLVR
jgi:hypothetical protein